MARIVRKCTKCETVDARQMWRDTTEASESGALDNWTCPGCAWPEAELVDVESQEPANA